MTDWARGLGVGLVGWIVMIAGAVVVLVGIVGLLADLAPSPTAAAILAGATLLGVGAALTREDGFAAGAAGGIWEALVGTTRSRAEVMAGDLPEHLRPLFVDLARGGAAARYVELSKTLERQLHAAAALPAGRDAVDVVAAAVRAMASASVAEAWDAVSALDRPAREAPSPDRTDAFEPVARDDDTG